MTNNKLERTVSEQTNKMLSKFDEMIRELKMIRKDNRAFWQVQIERLTRRVERLEQHAGLQPIL